MASSVKCSSFDLGRQYRLRLISVSPLASSQSQNVVHGIQRRGRLVKCWNAVIFSDISREECLLCTCGISTTVSPVLSSSRRRETAQRRSKGAGIPYMSLKFKWVHVSSGFHNFRNGVMSEFQLDVSCFLKTSENSRFLMKGWFFVHNIAVTCTVQCPNTALYAKLRPTCRQNATSRFVQRTIVSSTNENCGAKIAWTCCCFAGKISQCTLQTDVNGNAVVTNEQAGIRNDELGRFTNQTGKYQPLDLSQTAFSCLLASWLDTRNGAIFVLTTFDIWILNFSGRARCVGERSQPSHSQHRKNGWGEKTKTNSDVLRVSFVVWLETKYQMPHLFRKDGRKAFRTGLHAFRSSVSSQDMENKIRNTLNEIYFGKTKDIINGLRSTTGAAEERKRDELRNEIAEALKSRTRQNWCTRCKLFAT